jgi:arginine decarboxylase
MNNNTNDNAKSWGIDKAREVYNVARWGSGYVDVNAQGRLIVRPGSRARQGIDLHALADDLQQRGLALPVLVRFTDILHDRIDRLCGAFEQAMTQHAYAGRFTAVYPIKVNQQQSVVHELTRHGGARMGLEAGSKPELMAVLALSTQTNGTIVCNGYKDREYIRLALIGQQLGHRVHIVLEKPAELDIVIEEAKRLGITPRLGVRVRLASIGKGNWQNTGGEKSKFGFSAAHLLQVVARLRQAGMADSLCLLHCHMGSQLTNIRDIQQGLRECSRYFAALHELGINIRTVDVGGGLGIDYEGTHSSSVCSINYSLQEYANNIVHTFWETCREHGIAHPDIITESGRALTAHHAVLLMDVVDVERVADITPHHAPKADDPQLLHDLWDRLSSLSDPQREAARTPVEVYHDALHWKGEAQSLYLHGVLTLEQKALAEELHAAICQQVRTRLNPLNRSHRAILDELNEKLADKYFCNFSLFQSLPDVWALDQIFPIAPLHRLDEEPTRRGTLQDMTCDSDGRIDRYVDGEGIESSLPLHAPRPGEPYRLGVFLIGAYQEILGDMHNLFGDTNAVNVRLDADGGYRLEAAQEGDTVDEVLRYVHFEPEEFLAAYRAQLAASKLDAARQAAYLTELEAGLRGYTYLEE